MRCPDSTTREWWHRPPSPMTSRRHLLAAAGVLFLLAQPTCVDYEDGIVVEVAVLHHDGQRADEIPAVNPDGAPRRFTTDLGYEVELDHGYLVVESVQLVQCAQEGARA